MDRFLKNNAKASVKDFMSSKEFVAKYRYTPSKIQKDRKSYNRI